MVKRLTLIFSLLLIVSCGAKKIDVSKISTTLKTDSTLVVKVDGTYVKDNNIFINESTDEVEYKPMDSLKPMVIDGKQYLNTVIKSKKNKSVKIDRTKATSKISSVKKLNVKREDKKDTLDKHIKKEINYWMYLWFLIPIIIIWLLEKYGKIVFPFLNFFK